MIWIELPWLVMEAYVTEQVRNCPSKFLADPQLPLALLAEPRLHPIS